jgi:hypothetical protein
LIRFDDWTGNDNNGLMWVEIEDKPKGYIEESNGSGGIIVCSLLFTNKIEIKG